MKTVQTFPATLSSRVEPRRIATSARRREAIASKYCFSARCPIKSGELETTTIGLVFGYDAKPTISGDVDEVCRIFCGEAGYVPGEVELFMHSECPVELHNEVFVTVFQTPLDEEVSMETMHQIAVRDQFQRPKPSSSSPRDSGDDEPPLPPPFGGRPPPPDSPPGGKGGPSGSIHRVPKTPTGGGGFEMSLP